MPYEICNQRLGIDFFDTLNKQSKLMQRFLEKLMASGIEVYIISGASEAQLKIALATNSYSKGKHYKEAIAIDSYLTKAGFAVSYKMDGSYSVHNNTWWLAKSLICKKHRITTMVDSESRFKNNFEGNCKTRFVLNNYAFIAQVRDYLEEPKEEKEEEDPYEVLYPPGIGCFFPS